MIWNTFRRKTLSDAQKSAFADAIADVLKLQLVAVGEKTIDSEAGGPKPKAVGYVYGFIDAALRTKGWDMADVNIGVPIMYHVLRQLWPGREQEFLTFLVEHLSDPQRARRMYTRRPAILRLGENGEFRQNADGLGPVHRHRGLGQRIFLRSSSASFA